MGQMAAPRSSPGGSALRCGPAAAPNGFGSSLRLQVLRPEGCLTFGVDRQDLRPLPAGARSVDWVCDGPRCHRRPRSAGYQLPGRPGPAEDPSQGRSAAAGLGGGLRRGHHRPDAAGWPGGWPDPAGRVGLENLAETDHCTEPGESEGVRERTAPHAWRRRTCPAVDTSQGDQDTRPPRFWGSSPGRTDCSRLKTGQRCRAVSWQGGRHDIPAAPLDLPRQAPLGSPCCG